MMEFGRNNLESKHMKIQFNPKFKINDVVYVPECENRLFMGSFEIITCTTIESFFIIESNTSSGVYYHLKNFSGKFTESQFFSSMEQAQIAIDEAMSKKSCIE